nr:hypothetical protein [Neisseria canis]
MPAATETAAPQDEPPGASGSAADHIRRRAEIRVLPQAGKGELGKVGAPDGNRAHTFQQRHNGGILRGGRVIRRG